ncbi:GGDEF domain-containing protein [Rhodococcus sp. 27YEA15]|uniref:GGDEF domain-containing protein n=1 Tax=Rhodococcus sp. 27YEA15 TaxID=3156259 RepID=UPI003C7A61A1
MSIAAERGRACTGAILIDVDNFKSINDGYGHDCGDRVLEILAGRLDALAGPSVAVARTGGDEFAVACAGSASDLRVLAETVLRKAHVSTDECPITVSIGVATSTGRRAEDPSTHFDIVDAVDRADRAMYRAKTNGRNQVAVEGDEN